MTKPVQVAVLALGLQRRFAQGDRPILFLRWMPHRAFQPESLFYYIEHYRHPSIRLRRATFGRTDSARNMVNHSMTSAVRSPQGRQKKVEDPLRWNTYHCDLARPRLYSRGVAAVRKLEHYHQRDDAEKRETCHGTAAGWIPLVRERRDLWRWKLSASSTCLFQRFSPAHNFNGLAVAMQLANVSVFRPALCGGFAGQPGIHHHVRRFG